MPSLDKLLLPYQKNYILDPSRRKICEKARRIGITFSESLWSVRKRLAHRIDHLFSSSSEETSKEFIKYCIAWAAAFRVILRLEELDLGDQRAQMLTFPNGARIVALSSSPRSFRSWGGDVTLDEFAHSLNDAELYVAAQPVTQWGGELHIISSHNGTGTEFYKLCEGARAGTNGFSIHKLTLYDAVAQGLAIITPGEHQKLMPNVLACNSAFLKDIRSSCLSDAHWKQEYMVEAMSAETLIAEWQYNRLIKELVPETPDPLHTYGELLLGIDVARVHDLTAVWVVERLPNPNSIASHDRYYYRTISHLIMRGVDIPTQYNRIRPILEHKNLVKAVIDQGSIGRALVDSAVNDYGDLIVPFNFTNPSKARIAERVSGFIAQNRISVPESALVKADILSVKRIVNKNSSICYEGRTRESHADRFWSLALCLEGAVTTEGGFSYSMGSQDSADGSSAGDEQKKQEKAIRDSQGDTELQEMIKSLDEKYTEMTSGNREDRRAEILAGTRGWGE